MIRFIETKPRVVEMESWVVVRPSAVKAEVAVGQEQREKTSSVSLIEIPGTLMVEAELVAVHLGGVEVVASPPSEVSFLEEKTPEAIPPFCLKESKILAVRKLTVKSPPINTSILSDTTALHRTVVKTQVAEPELVIRKLRWVINPSENGVKPAIRELELPKDQNQRLYVFLHFLRQMVKEVFGDDVLLTRKVTMMRGDEPVEVDNPLASLEEIEYYLDLLIGNHAQVFAFVN
ncbi:hypothetical protein HZB97_00735 [Candidatus Gottesmanbacteria bacterium]|nr:hypothetical protein [Candidatus Gottesmanbacteria bacterium]